MTTEEKIIKNKLGLLQLAEDLGNVSQACRVMGYSRDSFYRFRELYAEELEFQGNRAIILSLSQPLPEAVIKHCLELALTYQQRKHLPLLGA